MNDHLHIIFAPMLPLPALAVLAASAAILCAWALYRRARGAVLRAVLFALLVLALANPALVREKREALHDTALLVVDDSASMQLGERTAQAARVVEAMTKKLAAFPDLDVETLHVAGDEETDLFHAIDAKRASLPADRFAGIIAVTDGQVHDLPATPLAAPLHALIAGQKNETDRRLRVTSAPAYGLVGQQVTLTVRIEDAPKALGGKAHVTLTHDDGKEQSFDLPVEEDVPLPVTLSHAGANFMALEVESVPGELTTLNNTATVSINGVRDHMRVLLVSGQPHAGGRTWRNLLKSDPAVDLVHFTILRSPLKDNRVPSRELSLIAFPSQEIFDTKLSKFDLVIFDGFSNRSLVPDAYLNNIARYVENGGALLVASATDEQAGNLGNSPLERILPTAVKGDVLTGAFVPHLSDAGNRHPVTAALGAVMPPAAWSPWYRQVDSDVEKSDAEILLTGLQQKPLLVLSHVGKGRVAQFLSDQFWLWARDYPHGGPQAELLRRTAHWLVAEPELDETALHAKAEKTAEAWQIVISKQSLTDDHADVAVTGPDNQPLQVKLAVGDKAGILRATVPVKNLGLYHIKDQDHEILVMAGNATAPEFGAMIATTDVLTPLVKASGGTTAWLADTPNGPEIRRTDKDGSQSGWGWIGLKKNGQYRVTGSEVTPLWPAWVALALLLGVAMLVWRREGR